MHIFCLHIHKEEVEWCKTILLYKYFFTCFMNQQQCYVRNTYGWSGYIFVFEE